jgi:hypothetical protein
MAGLPHYDVVEHFDFEKLSSANEVARHLNVALG